VAARETKKKKKKKKAGRGRIPNNFESGSSEARHRRDEKRSWKKKGNAPSQEAQEKEVEEEENAQP